MMIRDQGGMDVWVYDLDRESLTKLTFSGDNFSPIWSPDGNRVVFGRVEASTVSHTVFFPSLPMDARSPCL